MLALFEGVWSFAVNRGKKRKTKTAAVFAEAGSCFPLSLRSLCSALPEGTWSGPASRSPALPPASGFRRSEKGGFFFRASRGEAVFLQVSAKCSRLSPLNVPEIGGFPLDVPEAVLFLSSIPEAVFFL